MHKVLGYRKLNFKKSNLTYIFLLENYDRYDKITRKCITLKLWGRGRRKREKEMMKIFC